MNRSLAKAILAQATPRSLATKLLIKALPWLIVLALVISVGTVGVIGVVSITGAAQATSQILTQNNCGGSGSATNTNPVSATSANAASAVSPDQLGTNIPDPYRKIFVAAAGDNKIEPELLAAVFKQTQSGAYPDPPAPYGKGAPWPTAGAGASGPFQIPTSEWSMYGSDADASGMADVNDLTDASYGAAKWLSGLGAGIGTPAGDKTQTSVKGTLANALAQFRVGSEGNLTSADATSFVDGVLTEYTALKGGQTAGDSVSLENKIRQTFIVGFDAQATPKDTIRAVAKAGIGGMFIVNTKDAAADGFTKDFFDELGQLAGTPLTVAIDNEGGRIQIMPIGRDFPSAKDMGAMSDDDVKAIGVAVGQAATAAGVNMNLAPVLDIDSGRSADKGDIISGLGRSFSADPVTVASKAIAYASGITQSPVIVTLKHFPDIGDASGVSANNTDVAKAVSAPIATLRQRDLPIYRQVLAAIPSATVMMSNMNIAGLSDDEPASVSAAAVTLLRSEVGFSGIVTTDDLNVPSVISQVGDLPTAVKKAFEAGVDRPLFGRLPQDADAATAAVQAVVNATADAVKSGEVSLTSIDSAYAKVTASKKGAPLPVTASQPNQPKTTLVNSASTCCATATTGQATTATGGALGGGQNNAEVVYKYLLTQKYSANGADYPYTPIGAAGMVGNMVGESGVEAKRQQGVFDHLVDAAQLPDPSSVSGRGWGLVQWTPWTKFIQAASLAGRDPNSLKTQVDWLINDDPQFTAAIKQEVNNAATPQAAADVFFKKFEQAGDSSGSVRQRYAQAVYDWMTAGTPLPSDIEASISKTAAASGLPTQSVAVSGAQAIPTSGAQPVAATQSAAPAAGTSGAPVIALDPGHGGTIDQYIDPVTGLADRETDNQPEGTQVLEVANMVKTQLEAVGYQVVLLRDGTGVPNKRERVDKAVAAKANLVVSIHTGPGLSDVWPQRVGSYREYNGTRVTFSNQATADASLKVAQAMATARTAAEGHAVGIDENLDHEAGSFNDERSDVPTKGNLSLVQLWSPDIPWVYNEIAHTDTDAKSISSDMEAKYAAGIVEGIKASVPLSSSNTVAATDTQPANNAVSSNCAASGTQGQTANQATYIGASDCNAPGNTTRQKVVCIAQAELTKWQSGEIKPGTGYYKYSQNRPENWCADFSTWVYNEAGYSVTGTAEWNVPAVSDVWTIGQSESEKSGGRFKYTPAGNYTPVPGDLVIHKNGSSHINIVVSVDGSTLKMLGGNQGPGGYDTSTVNIATANGFSGGDITGYVSPTN